MKYLALQHTNQTYNTQKLKDILIEEDSVRDKIAKRRADPARGDKNAFSQNMERS